jgi:general secretion pathway protein M
MIAQLPRVQRRILAVLLVILVLFGVIQLLLKPIWNTYIDNREAIIQYQDQIARYSRLSSQVSALQSAVAELQNSDDLAPYVFPQESESLAAAALQQKVKSVVTASGGTLTSTQVMPTVPEKDFRRIMINVRMAVSTDALQGVFHDLESSLPYLLIDDIIILSRSSRRRRNQAVDVDLLDVRFNLSGYMRATDKPA